MKRARVSNAGIVILIGISIAGCSSAIPESPVPDAENFSQQQIKQGRVLAGIGNCSTCHTNDPDKPYAGGLAVPTPFGVIYSVNITPDPNNGMGRWSEAAFVRAMRKGVARDGSHLFPAFPYTHFAKATDDDLKALYAYLMTRTPVDYEPPENTLGFPYNIRLLQAGWKMLFFDDSPWQDVVGKSEEWNRGAYLAEGLGHCSSCHTPRNRFGAERSDAEYAGASVDGWYAPALTSAHEAPVPWTREDTFDYLRHGGSPLHGVAVGSMSEVVHDGLAEASNEDLKALAIYFSDMSAADSDIDAMQIAEAIISEANKNSNADLTRGSMIFTAACASCHYNSPDKPNTIRPELSLNSAVSVESPDNLIRITLEGVSVKSGLPGVMMPGFATALSDEDMVSLLSFMRRTQSTEPPWPNLAERVRQLRQ